MGQKLFIKTPSKSIALDSIVWIKLYNFDGQGWGVRFCLNIPQENGMYFMDEKYDDKQDAEKKYDNIVAQLYHVGKQIV